MCTFSPVIRVKNFEKKDKMTKNNLKIVKSSKNQDSENKEKNKALEAAISQIDDTFGKG